MFDSCCDSCNIKEELQEVLTEDAKGYTFEGAKFVRGETVKVFAADQLEALFQALDFTYEQGTSRSFQCFLLFSGGTWVDWDGEFFWFRKRPEL